MDTISIVCQFFLSLSLLIVLHEMGHFAPAKWFKTRVEKFYLFFDFAPFNSLWKTKKGETEYGIGWLPLGGYVKISGMVDESMDTEQLKSPPQPWEFRSKPAWQRLIIMIGGVTVNFILGFFIYAMILWYFGKAYVPTSELKQYGMAYDSILLQQGFQQGDLLLKLEDKPFNRVDPAAFVEAVVLSNTRHVTVSRNGKDTTLTLSDDIAKQITSQRVPKAMLMAPRMPFYIGQVAAGKPAEIAGIQKGDRIVSFNGQSIPYFDQFTAMAQKHKGQSVVLGIERNGQMQNLNVEISAQGTIGVGTKSDGLFNIEREKYSLAEALPGGVKMGIDFLSNQIKAFGQMFKGNISVKDNLGSVISIGKLFSPSWDWEIFWNVTASLSIILAFMNLLPIPALDGGYVVFLIWEVVTGRKVSDQFMERAVTVGFFLLLGLMVLAFGLDIWRHFLQKLF
jgi:regulator of sigma E protease